MRYVRDGQALTGTSGYAVHALAVAGGTMALSPMPGRDGHYEADVAHLRGWSPDLVISMTTSDEMARAGAAGLGRDLKNAGIRWAHFPVEDFSTPAPAVEGAWPDISREVQAVIRSGGRVLVHCHGGCGRSGMALLRLMIEAGDAPETSLGRLRAVRPCAVETAGQMRWAMAVDTGHGSP